MIDILYYKEKIGIDSAREVMTQYLKREDRDINRLFDYAAQLNTVDTLRNYLEILL